MRLCKLCLWISPPLRFDHLFACFVSIWRLVSCVLLVEHHWDSRKCAVEELWDVYCHMYLTLRRFILFVTVLVDFVLSFSQLKKSCILFTSYTVQYYSKVWGW